MAVLVTGGAGYIGSHMVLALLDANEEVVVLDNLSTGFDWALPPEAKLVVGDMGDRELALATIREHRVEAIAHFAAKIVVPDSLADPLGYYLNNTVKSRALIESAVAGGVKQFIFSSTAAVYGEPSVVPVPEDLPLNPINPYGRSKLMVEQILHDLAASDPRWSIALLRYFNPVGAHESGLIGEDPNGVPNNLLPYISQVAIGKLRELLVFGDDYPTRDGTGVRDYIHVVDLARGHLKALHALARQHAVHVWNLGTGCGYSVLEMVRAFEEASGQPVPYRIAPRRPGDIAECWADPAKAARELGWRAERGLQAMMRDTWHWQSKNPQGYAE